MARHRLSFRILTETMDGARTRTMVPDTQPSWVSSLRFPAAAPIVVIGSCDNYNRLFPPPPIAGRGQKYTLPVCSSPIHESCLGEHRFQTADRASPSPE